MDNDQIKGLDAMVRKLNAVDDYIDNDLPLIIGTEAVNHFKESFVNEGFTDTGLQKWSSRKTKRSGGTNSQPVLSNTGELADSIEFRVEGKNIIITTDKKHAQIHNEGGTIKVTDGMRKYFWAMHYAAQEAGDEDLMNQWKYLALSKEIKIPKRQFIGESEVLNQRIAVRIERDLTNILK